MTEEARSAQREYMRRWRETNKDKLKVYRDRYWQRKAEAVKVENNGLHNYNKLGGDNRA
ncbi:MAG: hypothetical protein KBS74_07595 [Clostridiales bacterium]|nr:hypothetical protein [Candidatus Cacconaster stercorequi]